LPIRRLEVIGVGGRSEDVTPSDRTSRVDAWARYAERIAGRSESQKEEEPPQPQDVIGKPTIRARASGTAFMAGPTLYQVITLGRVKKPDKSLHSLVPWRLATKNAGQQERLTGMGPNLATASPTVS